ncbi:hypothetical protein JCM10914A_26550 [Paenibacillus sp. JCM 10914]|uniref:RNA polymerase sigma factor n=1 Tax=Paenibacillus sp. JCM 10914 TaxID=1236974 RepID=UPI0003CC8543|nr:RNA polymerase sigma factor [Paenibacillus sp. JCM 10914]GAE07732.1 RNA polymerase ECF-type sigma factor [Paenibacillus sp. JCM 10914]
MIPPSSSRSLPESLTLWLPELKRYCLKLTAGSNWDADDLIQECLIKLHNTLAASPERTLSKAYVYRVARNAWIDQYRKEVQTQPLPDGYEGERYTESSYLTRENLEILTAALTAHQVVLIVLVDVFRYTAKEAALMIESTEGAVKETLKRARKRLQSIHASTKREGRTISPPRTGRMSGEWLDSFIHAFQTANGFAVANTYLSMREADLTLQQVQRLGRTLYFTFQDPDGHWLTCTTAILLPPVSFS